MCEASANALLEFNPRAESDSAYHFGANISMLSQYEHECRVLSPLCMVLEVVATAARVVGAG
jgi:hypothetical protein